MNSLHKNKKSASQSRLIFGERADFAPKEKTDAEENKRKLEKLTNQIDQWVKNENSRHHK